MLNRVVCLGTVFALLPNREITAKAAFCSQFEPWREFVLIGAGKYSVVFKDCKVLDHDLLAIAGKLHSPSPDAGVFARKIVGEGITIPVREFVVGAAGRQA